jgi:hypothetical protein
MARPKCDTLLILYQSKCPDSRLQTPPPPPTTWLHVLINQFRVCHTFCFFCKMPKWRSSMHTQSFLEFVCRASLRVLQLLEVQYGILFALFFCFKFNFCEFDIFPNLTLPLCQLHFETKCSTMFTKLCNLFYCPKLVDAHV